MSIYPRAVQKLLPENSYQTHIEPTQIIWHTAVDAPGKSSLFPYFSRTDVTAETHFFIRLDGVVEQYMDTNRRADANNRANDKAISVETEDEGNPEGMPWTWRQLDSMKLLMEWAFKTHPGIKRQVCKAWDDPGVGYHTMWGAPSNWTTVPGKTCPGSTRIRQFKDLIVPWIETPPQAGPIEREEAEDMRMIQNKANGAVLLVTGGVAILIVNAAERDAHSMAGIPLLAVGQEQFSRYEKLRVA